MNNTIIKIYKLMSDSERRETMMQIIQVVMMATLDVVGVASIMPFTMVAANPELIQSNSFMRQTYQWFEFSSVNTFMLFLGMGTLAALMTSMAFKAYVTYTQTKFVLSLEHIFACRLITQYIHQPYVWYLNKNSSEIGKTLLSEITTVFSLVMTPIMNLIAQAFIALALLLLVIAVDAKLAITVFLTLGLSYGLVHWFTGGKIKEIGKNRLLENSKRYSTVMEAFNAIKEIKFAGNEGLYIQRFSKPSSLYVEFQATYHLVSVIPRFAIEAIAFGGMLIVMIYMLRGGGELSNAVPVIALYGMAGYRLMPALQQIYSSIVALTYSGAAMSSLYDEMTNTKIDQINSCRLLPISDLKYSIELKNVKFGYPNTNQVALENVNVSIPANKTVGIVGGTGSGKTTLIDIVLGLLRPTSGTVTVDDMDICDEQLQNWRKQIGYVPQNIFLLDDSVCANIAFGIERSDINIDRVKKCAEIAKIDEAISYKFSNGYDTIVGERGIKLSGGERQRIGIARALYRSPKILVFDEATSSLDNLTENAVMDAVSELGHKMTIIMVAHRLATLRKCDVIYHIENGRVKSYGDYEYMLNTNPIFKA